MTAGVRDSLERVLEQNGYRYAPGLEPLYRKELESFYEQLMTESGGRILDSELESMLEGFAVADVIEKTEPAGGAGIQEKEDEEPEPEAEEEKNVPELSDAPVFMVLGAEDKSSLSGDVFGSIGCFQNPKRSGIRGKRGVAFEYRTAGKTGVCPIRKIDPRFEKLVAWLGEKRAGVLLMGRLEDGLALVTGIHSAAVSGESELLSVQESFLQFSIMRLLTSRYHPEEKPAPERFNLTRPQEMEDYCLVAANALPPSIRTWARQNLDILKNESVSTDEKRHARRALSMMLDVRWEPAFFPSIDPVRARQILDESLYGLERVKQRVIETIIQINRTHTLPAYGLLLVGPAGTGKSQVAYAVARILGLPWASLDMSAIRDPEALTGSPRIYVNAKPGRIIESFVRAQSSNIVFVINELDKAGREAKNGNPGDALLTLLDNLGFTDNYMECTVPTDGVYPIATANDLEAIPAPLLSRFALIMLDDYTPDEKRTIFTRYSLPKILGRMGMKNEELKLEDAAVDWIIKTFGEKPGVRELEQIAEHLAGNCLYRIETGEDVPVYDLQTVRALLEE